MKYISSRGYSEKINSCDAILKGIAPDGGLFVPEIIPKVNLEFINNLKNLSYEEKAKKILSLYLTDYTEEELTFAIQNAYEGDKFENSKIAPIKNLRPIKNNQNLSLLELFRGPTSAFKDMALEILPHLLSLALKKTGEKNDILILVATSGDTGKAALVGFKDAPRTKIIVFYPENGVSNIQKAQMTTSLGKNVNVVAIRGNFDDAQSAVKSIFEDIDFNNKLLEKGIKLSSANSINWGRLVPQIVYYFSAYADLIETDKIKLGEKISFSVPTGNFGDILAAYYAKCMGLPVDKLIVASNENNVLTDFFKTGIYDKNRPFKKTISPSMDILISSNLERLLYHVTNAEKVKEYMAELKSTGKYKIEKEVLSNLQETFLADYSNEEQTKNTIKEVYEKDKIIIDPHTAVAYKATTSNKETVNSHIVVVGTASPYKFPNCVLSALGKDIQTDDFGTLDVLESISDDKIPKGLKNLNDKKILFKETIDNNEIKQAILKFA